MKQLEYCIIEGENPVIENFTYFVVSQVAWDT